MMVRFISIDRRKLGLICVLVSPTKYIIDKYVCFILCFFHSMLVSYFAHFILCFFHILLILFQY
jgi:hypothetical protein